MKGFFGKKKKGKNVDSRSLSVISPKSSCASRSTNTQSVPDATKPKAYYDTIEVVEQLLGIAKEASEATDVLSPLKSASALILRSIQAIRESRYNKLAWLDLCNDLEQHLVQMEADRDELLGIPSIEDGVCLHALEQYISVTADVIKRASVSGSESGVSAIIKDAGTAQVEKEEIIRCRDMLQNAWNSYQVALKRSIALKVEVIATRLDKFQQGFPRGPGNGPIQDDYGVVGSDYTIAYGDRVDICEEGTRVEILDRIREWANDLESQSQIFWLNDAAGTGKSTIATTMAKEWFLNNRLAGRFFFSPNSRTTQTTKEFCQIVAEDIARNHPSVASLIRGTMKEMSPDQGVWFDVQLQRLIIEPIARLQVNDSVLIVIDALDNCVVSDERAGLLNTFIRHLPSVRHLKLFLTGRPVQDITDILSPCPLVHGADIQLLNIRSSDHPDINRFVEKRLKDMSFEDRAMIIARSGGLFLYAATVCRMLERSRHRLDVLKIVSDVGVTDKLERRMDILYLSVLKQALVDKEARDMMLDVLSMIIVAYQPLSSNTIRQFLPDNIYVDDFVQDLGGVLKDGHPDRPIRVLHPTFRDFILSNEDRANGFLIHSGRSASDMAYACIATLEHILEDDMFHLDDPNRFPPRNGDIESINRLILEKTTAAERYASAFWAHHVATSEMTPKLWSRVMGFLSKKYLNWVELMSWRGSIGLCIEGLSRLREIVGNIPEIDGNEEDTLTVLHAHQFLIHHQTIIVEAALQAYCMALFFTPLDSPIFRQYRERYRLLQPEIVTSVGIEWEDHITLRGHSARIDQLIFSPDGSRLISIDIRGLLQLWNPETGALIGKPFQGGHHRGSHSIIQCTFSADSQQFGFFNFPGELHIRYSYNGEPVFPYSGWKIPSCFAFSSTLSFIVCIGGSSITQWNIKRGKESQKVGELAPKFTPREVAVSPDDEMAVVVGTCEGVKDSAGRAFLWELSTCTQVQAYELIDVYHMPVDYVGVFFSPDSRRFAIASPRRGGGGQLYDGKTGKLLGRMYGLERRDRMIPVVFCPLSRHLAYTTDDSPRQIVVLEVQRATTVSTLKGHSGDVLYLSFSPDGRRLASVSSEQTVQVWDVLTGNSLQTIFPGYTGKIDTCILSADWRYFVSTGNHSIRLCDMRTGASGKQRPDVVSRYRYRHAILGSSYSGSIFALRKASGAGVDLWDTVTGASVKVLAPRDHVIGVAFSPDDEMIAALLGDGTIHTWNAKTFEQIEDLEINRIRHHPYGGILFSSDSTLIGAYHAAAVCVWNVKTRDCLLSYGGKSSSMVDVFLARLCAISLDNSSAAGLDEGDTLYVWDLGNTTNTSAKASLSPYLSETSAAFSPVDPSLLAVVQPPEVSLWRRFGEELQLVIKIEIDEDIYGSLSFSADGQYIAYGPLCWDVATTSTTLLQYSGGSPPPPFNAIGSRTHSFLFYRGGWICSAFPEGHLLPIPSEFRGMDLAKHWYAFGERVIFMNSSGEPIVIDCSSILARARQKVISHLNVC